MKPIKRINTIPEPPKNAVVIDPQATLLYEKINSMVAMHRLGIYWRGGNSHNADDFHCTLPLPPIGPHMGHKDQLDAFLETVIPVGIEYVIPLCLQDPYMKRSGAINEEQSDWFRAFGNRHDGMLAINPLDKTLEYEKYFGKAIDRNRIVYHSCIPEGCVLCFSWLRDNYIHMKVNPNGMVDVWMKYNTQITKGKYQHLDDWEESDEDIVDSMLVNIRGLSGMSVVDEVLNGLV